VPRDIATAAFMGLNVLARYLELEKRIREVDELDELAAEIEEIKRERTYERGHAS